MAKQFKTWPYKAGGGGPKVQDMTVRLLLTIFDKSPQWMGLLLAPSNQHVPHVTAP